MVDLGGEQPDRTRTVAVYNGLPETAQLLVGTTVYVPTVAEGAAALASGAPAVATPSIAGAGGQAAVSRFRTSLQQPRPPLLGWAASPHPPGQLPLAPAAADAWNAMRSEALGAYGTDIYPGGPASAYRTYQQQAELYDAYLAGVGEPANPPGTSSRAPGTAVDVATPQNAVAGRPDRMEVRLGQAPRAGRVVARRLRGRLTPRRADAMNQAGEREPDLRPARGTAAPRRRSLRIR